MKKTLQIYIKFNAHLLHLREDSMPAVDWAHPECRRDIWALSVKAALLTAAVENCDLHTPWH